MLWRWDDAEYYCCPGYAGPCPVFRRPKADIQSGSDPYNLQAVLPTGEVLTVH